MDSVETSTSSNGGAVRDGKTEQFDDDSSPYGLSPLSLMDHRPFVNASVSPHNSVSPSRGWDDISVSVIRGWLVRRCHADISLVQFGCGKDDVVVNKTYLAELQRRVLKAEVALREKDEEQELLLQRIQQYEKRWSDYEDKMSSMEELWQKQMNSLQSSLNAAKDSLSTDDTSDAPPIRNNESFTENGGGASEMTAGLSLISRLAEEFEQRSQVFGDDARFLVEVKSGEIKADLNPEEELRRLKQVFEGWKKDYGARLRETKVILNKLSSEEATGDKVKRNWWGRLNTSRGSFSLYE